MRHASIFALSLSLAASRCSLAQSPGSGDASVMPLGLHGVYFVENQGQWGDTTIAYGLHSKGLDVAFRESSFSMHLAHRFSGTADARPAPNPMCDPPATIAASAVDDLPQRTLTVTFPGSNSVSPIGAEPQHAKFNYFVGGEGRGAASHVPSFGSVIYRDLYEGIDLHIRGNVDGVLKYEFHVAPRADATQIQIAYDGIESLIIGEDGSLNIHTAAGTLTDAAPVAWQAPDTIVPAHFELSDEHAYRIALDAPVDFSRELIIDPDIEWMEFLGGSSEDIGYGIAADADGNVLVTGRTTSIDFEGATNSYNDRTDTFVLKLDPTGALLWMTYLGGRTAEYGYAVAVDHAGNALVTGYTASSDFVGRLNERHGDFDAYVLKVDPAGQLLWMTYVGGRYIDTGRGIAIDGEGSAYITGDTNSDDFEGRMSERYGLDDGFVAKVSASGETQWMAYIGGSGNDYARDIALDGDGNSFVTGETFSSDFKGRQNRPQSGNGDAFVQMIDSDGFIQWMYFLGGRSGDEGNTIALDGNGDIYIAGITQSDDLPMPTNSFHGAGVRDAFAMKANQSGDVLWSAYLGGNGSEYTYGMVLDRAGKAHITGLTDSNNFAGRNNAFHGPGADAFLLTVTPDGRLEEMFFLGGSEGETAWDIAVDSDDNVFVVGETNSTNFEGRRNTYHGDPRDAFVVKVSPPSPGPRILVDAVCPPGHPLRVDWMGSTPNGLIALIVAQYPGTAPIPPPYPCAGTRLGLGPIDLQLLYQGRSGPDGSGMFQLNSGPNLCRDHLQLLDLTTCKTSNVVVIE